MTEDERRVMEGHVAYWAPHVQKGTVLVLGPVGDPNGVYGLGVVRADEKRLATLLAEDPAILSGTGFRYDTSPMLRCSTPF